MRKIIPLILVLVVLWSGCVEENKNWEYYTKGIYEGNISMCEKINVQYRRDDCYDEIAKAKNDSTICYMIQNRYDRDGCISKIAKTKKDQTICAWIESRVFEDWCYMDIAKAKNDSTICLETHNSDRYYMCLSSISGNFSICDKIQDQDHKIWCYRDVAKAKNDSSICDKIQDRDKYYLCLTNFEEDPMLCYKIQDEYDRDMCYRDVAKAKNDSSICDKIQDSDKYYMCYIYFKKDPTLCDKLKEDYNRDDCYEKVANAHENSSICCKIKDIYREAKCCRDIDKNMKDGNGICESSRADIITISYLVLLVVGILILLIGILIFSPRKFKKKDIVASQVRPGKISKFLVAVFILILLLIFLLLEFSLYDLSSMQEELLLGIALVFILMAALYYQFVIASEAHSLIGCKAPELEGEIGKAVKENKLVMIYFFNPDAFRKELKVEAGPVPILQKNLEKSIKEINLLIEKIKYTSGVRVFEIDPLKDSNGKEIYDKFKLGDEMIMLLMAVIPYARIDIPSIVIISDGYIKEHWIGYSECRGGLVNFDAEKLGTISVTPMKVRIVNFIGMGVSLIFFGFLMLSLLGSIMGDMYVMYYLGPEAIIAIAIGIPVLLIILSVVLPIATRRIGKKGDFESSSRIIKKP